MHPRWADDIRTLAEASDVIITMTEDPAQRDNPLLPVFHEMVHATTTEMNNYLDREDRWLSSDVQAFWTEHTLRMSYIRMSIRSVTLKAGVLV